MARKSLPFQKIKEAVDLLDVCSFLQIDLKKTGATYRGTCPVCDEDRALAVTPGEGFICHHKDCGIKGDAINLVSEVEGVRPYEAASILIEQFGLEFGTSTSTKSKNRNSIRTVPAKRNSTVPKERKAKAILSDRLEAVLDRLQPEHPDIADLGLSEDTCLYFQAGYDAKGQNRGRLAVALHDATGELVGFAGIRLNGSGPEIVYPKNLDINQHIFNIHRMVSEGQMYMVTDILEVLFQYENGIENCVCRIQLPNNVVPLRKTG